MEQVVVVNKAKKNPSVKNEPLAQTYALLKTKGGGAGPKQSDSTDYST